MQRVFQLQSLDEARQLFGKQDQNLRLIRARFDVRIITRNGMVRVEGEEPDLGHAAEILEDLLRKIRKGAPVYETELMARLDEHEDQRAPGESRGPAVRIEKTVVQAKSPGQGAYIRTIQKTPIVFCTGPAGTGKTFLAVALALHELARGRVSRIVLARPAVEAGESLGFLPGDFQAKINPYLRPLYDALMAIVDSGRIRKYMEKEIIEIVPLAYMRGRTLDDSFIILDEGQNTTSKQMMMFLTRMGVNSKIVVTGDITQIDLPSRVASGLVQVHRILRDVRGVAFVELGKKDIVRHPLVQDIVDAFSDTEDHPHHDGDYTEGPTD